MSSDSERRELESRNYVIEGISLQRKLGERSVFYDKEILGSLPITSIDNGPMLEELITIFDLDGEMDRKYLLVVLQRLLEAEKKIYVLQQQIDQLVQLRANLMKNEPGLPGAIVRQVLSKFRMSTHG